MFIRAPRAPGLAAASPPGRAGRDRGHQAQGDSDGHADPAADWAATAGAGHIDWRLRAACRGEDPELFFPVSAMGPALLEAEQAKQVCRRCAVTGPCLVWALETGQDHGIWGGMSEEERRALRRP